MTKLNVFQQIIEAFRGCFYSDSLYKLRKQSMGSRFLFALLIGFFASLISFFSEGAAVLKEVPDLLEYRGLVWSQVTVLAEAAVIVIGILCMTLIHMGELFLIALMGGLIGLSMNPVYKSDEDYSSLYWMSFGVCGVWMILISFLLAVYPFPVMGLVLVAVLDHHISMGRALKKNALVEAPVHISEESPGNDTKRENGLDDVREESFIDIARREDFKIFVQQGKSADQ